MSLSSPSKQAAIESFLTTEDEKRALAEEVMTLVESVAEQRPDLVVELIDSIIPPGWEPTKPN